ncbi:MAG: signal peptide peptidase SppA [Sodalis sp. (in: enterobacteria)]
MYTFWEIIFRPFRWFWRLLNFIRDLILNVFLVILIIFIGIYLQIRHTSPTLTKGALVMNLIGTVVDKPAMNNKFRQLSREFLGASTNHLQENSLFDIVNTLRQAKKDPNITGLVLSLKDFAGADQASLEYIGKVLREFRDSGKPIYAVGDSYSQMQYYLASYANKIYLTPQGVVDLHGIATNKLYYKTLLDKLKINSHIFRVGTYKAAVEPFLRDNMSDAAREADSRWIDRLWQGYLTTVAINRQVTPAQLFPGAKAMLDGLRAVEGNNAQFALNNKWVDEIESRPEIDAILRKAFGCNQRGKAYDGISIYDYQRVTPAQQGNQIAVIFINGAIINGTEMPGSVGSDTTANQIRDAYMNPDIKAIVLRVNSPGGSITASEVIRSELANARAAGKPVVISMGGIAASGGYLVSTPANYIIASASTLTGSIGIFGIVNTVENSLDAIGVHTDGVATSPLADVSLTKTLPEEFLQMMQLSVENGYRNFITMVAKSRHKTPEEIDKIAQGHIWIGSDAVQNGLIDQVGDFDDAVSKAAELAQLKQYHLNWYLNNPALWGLLFTQTNGSVLHALLFQVIQSWLPAPVSQIVERVKMNAGLNFNWNDPQNHYAFCFSGEQILH